jgi:amyloid beta precursor protein binding protein 1
MATNDKYDRQIRIWGADGQRRLNTSIVLCLGISAAGTETLKNLALPGIGFIRIVSEAKVEERDFHRNFFLQPDSLGKNLAEEVLENLLEMNPDVKGDFRAKSVENYLEEDQEELRKASLIIVDCQTFVGRYFQGF